MLVWTLIHRTTNSIDSPCSFHGAYAGLHLRRLTSQMIKINGEACLSYRVDPCAKAPQQCPRNYRPSLFRHSRIFFLCGSRERRRREIGCAVVNKVRFCSGRRGPRRISTRLQSDCTTTKKKYDFPIRMQGLYEPQDGSMIIAVDVVIVSAKCDYIRMYM